MSEKPAATDQDQTSFARQAEEADPGLIREFLEFLRDNKKWWLIPILIVLALLGLATFLHSTAAPFIYPLF